MKKTIFIFLLLISAIPNVSGRSKFVSAPVDLPWKFMLDDGSKTWLFLANGYDVIDKGDTVSFRFSTGNNWMLTAYSSDFSPVNYVTSSLQGRCGQYYELLYTDAISGMHIEFRVEDGKLIRRVYGTTQQEHPVFSMDVRGAQVFYPACFGKKTQTVQCISPSGMFLSEESNEMIGDRSSSPAILTRENGTMELRYHLPVNLQSGSFDVEWFTYVGAADTDELLCVRDMPDGGVVVCGRTMSANFPGMDANDSLSGSYDMVIFRMDSAGQLLWTTIYGGLYYESANGMMVSDSSIYVAGSTNGNDIPLTNAFQTATGGSYDAVIVKLNFDGTIAQSSYFGGMGAEQAYGVDMDSAGKIVIGGSSTSASLPMSASGYQPAGAGAIDGFITVLNDSFAPQWTTFYGGTGSEDVHQLVITPLNKIVMIGGSFSLNFPCTPNAFQPGRLGNCDAYYVVFDMAGNREYATYYGGSSNEDCFGVAGDENGNIYLAGHTASIDFNITGVIFQPNFAGVNDAWITRFDSTGVPVFSTFFGGGMDDKTWGMMRRDGYLYISGVTHSSDLPMNVTAPQDSLWGASDGFVVKFDTA
ncbi:MAG TPA: SBBP repeat-containing protein, partial [Bacteroidia bacterium]|nr:SBBP repeat-containing protein [Bacteroidia bacterium]